LQSFVDIADQEGGNDESKSFISRVSNKHGKGDSANKINTKNSSAHVDNSVPLVNDTEQTV
jgi:hypothetical protein